jgi:uncharacterized protein (TIGR00251 family)
LAHWYRQDEKRDCLVLTLHIQPGARATRVVGPHADALKIQVHAAPIEGQANIALVKFLAKAFHVPASQVVLKQGSLGRHKVVEIFATQMGPEILWPNING